MINSNVYKSDGN